MIEMITARKYRQVSKEAQSGWLHDPGRLRSIEMQMQCGRQMSEREFKEKHFLSVDRNWRWLVYMVCITGMEVREEEEVGAWAKIIVGIHVAGRAN